MAENDIPQDIAKLSFEDAMEELQRIVQQLEAGKGKLDESIRSYERGAALKRHCENKLREAQLRIDSIVLGPDGATGTAPTKFD